MRAWLGEFWAGLTRPSAPALLGAVALAATLWGWLAAVLDPAWIASGAMVVRHDDDFAQVGAVSLSLPPVAEQHTWVVLLGSSATREALPDAGVLARLARAPTGPPLQVAPLVAAAMTPLEMLILAEALPPGLHGVAVVELSERNLAVSAEDYADIVSVPRLPRTATAVAPLLAETGLPAPRREVGNTFVDHAGFFLARPQVLRSLLTHQRAWYSWHQVDPLPPPTEADWRRLTRRMEGWHAASAESLARNGRIYGALVDTLRDRGLAVAFLASPRNPDLLRRVDADPAQGAARRAAQDRMDALAAGLGVPLWRVGDEVSLQAAEFKDYTHVFHPAARERFARRLAVHVGELLEGAP